MEVGYLYKGCVNPVWEVKIAYLPGCDMSASDIGGWNLHIHHVYNWRYGIVYRGDGSHLYLPMQPWRLRPLIGDGHTPRDAACTTCSESLFIYKRVREPTALATDRMGNVYMMDGLQLRRINPAISEVVTIGHVKGKRSETAGSAEIGGELGRDCSTGILRSTEFHEWPRRGFLYVSRPIALCVRENRLT